MNKNQQHVYDTIAKAASLSTPSSGVSIEQAPTFLKEPVQIADFGAGMIAAYGASAAELGEARGLPSQDVTVDRRHATLSLNDGMYNYLNGVVIIGGEITVPVNGFFETRDGKWLCFNGAYPHLRDGILKYFDAPHDQPKLIEAVKKHDSEKILEDFEQLGLCAAPMHTHEQWLSHPQGEALASQPVVRLEQRGSSKARVLPEAKQRPLEGVRVVDCTHVIAGPWLSRMLVEHGADCISIRNAAFPFLYPAIYMESYDKKQILLDFKMKRSFERFIELIKEADVLVWGYHAPALERLGLTVDKLQELNPSLVLVRETCYGLEGRWKNRKGWEQLAQTTCGAVELASQGRDQKHLIAALPTDYGTGYLGATAAMAALRQRQEHGGFWDVQATLCGTIMLALELPHEAEEAVPVSIDDMKKYLVDQDSDIGGAVFSRLAPVAKLSKTPAFYAKGPAILGQHDPFKTTWGPLPGAATSPPHRPSEFAKEERLYGLLTGYGHEDIMLRPEKS
jgi:crotonobetainyl-CoA:carnitine CoA-transferase CaiB-like acyl-CoA transferase